MCKIKEERDTSQDINIGFLKQEKLRWDTDVNQQKKE